jgi:hypothetical protein
MVLVDVLEPQELERDLAGIDEAVNGADRHMGGFAS